MKVILKGSVGVTYEIDAKFPIYRDHIQGEEGFPDYEKTYWRFESESNATVIIERNSETEIKIYNDPNLNVFTLLANENMLFGQYSYSIISEQSWDWAINRLINRVAKAV